MEQMAELIANDEELGEIEVVESQQEPSVTEKPKEPEQPDLPEAYKGKSPAELARMLEESQKFIKRQSEEVGEVRKLADELLKAQLARNKEPEQPKDIDIFENPSEAVNQMVASNPKLQTIEQQNLQLMRQMNMQRLAQAHPDMNTVSNEPEFIDWVKQSPVRLKLFNEAHNNFDFDAGNELLSTYKTIKAAKAAQTASAITNVEKEARNQSVKAASVDTSGTNETSKKIYRRIDLMKLMQTDPERYDALHDEIARAYSEGRVR